MLDELEFHHRTKNERRYLLLNRSEYRIGKGLDNDIVLLDADCPAYLVKLEKKEGQYRWVAFSSIESSGYVFQIRSNRSWVYALSFVLIFWISLLFFQWLENRLDSPQKKIQTLPARGTYGNLDTDRSVSDIRFEFQSQIGKFLRLHYTSGNIERLGDLELLINGKFLTFAPASSRKWNVETSIFIPNELLKIENNLLEFIFRGKSDQSWGVKDIYVTILDEKPAQPNDKEYAKNIRKLLREKKTKPGNIVRAQQIIQQYRFTNQNLPEELEKLDAKIIEEKTKMIQDHQILIQKYKREGEVRKAREIYQHLMDELIDPMDLDRSQIEEQFNE